MRRVKARKGCDCGGVTKRAYLGPRKRRKHQALPRPRPVRIAACKRPSLLLFSSEESRMDKTVDVTIPVEPDAAAALTDARNREAVGRLVSRVLRPRAGPSPLAQAIAELKAEARAVGLSDADIDAELVAYNAERRDRSSG